MTVPADREDSAITLLPAMVEHARDDLRRADTTVGIYLVTIAGLAAMIGQIGHDLTPITIRILAVAALPATGVLIQAVRVWWPRGTNNRYPEPGSWVHVATTANRADAEAIYTATPASGVLITQLRLLAGIATRKYRQLRWATIWLTLTALPLLTALATGLT